jgi:hypothetical protein
VETQHRVEVHHIVDHDREAIDQLRMFKRLNVAHEKLVEMFGYSGLGRYERLLEQQDGKAAPKLIDASAVEVTPADKP